MSRSSTLILVGLLTLIISFAGIPLAWLHVLLPILGLATIIVGFLMRTDRIAEMKRSMPSPPTSAPVASPNDISPIA
jgi:Na+/H+-dicarboxylate symporter